MGNTPPPPDNSHLTEIAKVEAETERQRLENERLKSEEETKREQMRVNAEIEKEKEKANLEREKLEFVKQQKLEEAKRAKMAADTQVKIAKENAAIERLKLKNEEEQKMREMKEKQYDREHQVRMQQMKEEAARKEQLQKAEMERQKQAHIQKLKQMQIDKEEKDKNKKIKQRNDSIKACDAEITKLDKLIDTDTKQLEVDMRDFGKIAETLDAVQLWIDNFTNYKKLELDKMSTELQLKSAKINFERDDEQIKAAISDTGQIEENVGNFLVLTHRMLGATRATTSHSNKLQAQIAAFSELIQRECSGKLSIEQYFSQNNLSHFTPILAKCKSKYINVDELQCAYDEEFEELLGEIQNGLEEQEQQKQLPLVRDDDDPNNDYENADDVDDQKEDEEMEEEPAMEHELKGEALAEKLLTDWGLIKFFDVMKENGWGHPEDWGDLIEDKNELKECGFKGGFKATFRREFNAWKEDNGTVSAEKRKLLKLRAKYGLISFKEMKILRRICFELCAYYITSHNPKQRTTNKNI